MSEEKPRLEPASNGYQVHYRGRRLYAPKDPRGGAARRATAREIASGTLVIAVSPLLGYGVTELLDACPPDAVVLAVELDPDLAALTADGPADSRLYRALAPSPAELEALIPRLLAHRPRRTTLVSLSGGFALHADAYRRVAARLDDEIRLFWQNAMTRVRMGRLWIRNLLRNLPLLPASTPLDELRTDLPVLVAGAGPSLDVHAADIPQDGRPQRRRLRILAVDTAVAPLAAHGITPDIVLAVESQQANAADFLLPRNPDGTRPWAAFPFHIICDLTSYPGVVHRVPPHRVSFVSSQFAQTALLERLQTQDILPEPVPPLGSVGVLAVHLARRLTTAPVAFLGLDFAYDLEGTHARGAPMQVRALATRSRLDPSPFFGPAIARPLLTLPGKSGTQLRTDTVLLSYAEQLQRITAGEAAVYDASPRFGLPSGAPPAPHDWATAAAAPAEAADRDSHFPDTETVRAALEQEHERVVRLTRNLRAALAAAGTADRVAASTYEELRPALVELDYLYLDFPDSPSASRSFLGRLLLSALSYEERIGRALRIDGLSPPRT